MNLIEEQERIDRLHARAIWVKGLFWGVVFAAAFFGGIALALVAGDAIGRAWK